MIRSTAGRGVALGAVSLIASVLALPAVAEVPSTYPAGYADIVAAAKKEAALSIYGTTDSTNADPVLDAFRAEYPEIAIEYTSLNSAELYNRVISEKAAGQPTVDVLWTGGQDQAMQLGKDGYAATYKSPEAEFLPEWARWNDSVYATTSEPLVFGYNKTLLAADAVPQSHDDLLRFLVEKKDAFDARVGMSDPTGGTASTTWAIYDTIHMPKYWELVGNLGAAHVKYSTAALSLEKIGSGELVFAWNLQAPYAVAAAAANPNIGVVVPSDYAITQSRVTMVAADAPHPNAAKVFLDFLLSHRGQVILAGPAKLYSIRTDVDGEYTYGKLKADRGDAIRPIPVSEDLLKTTMDADKRTAFIQKFRETVAAGANR